MNGELTEFYIIVLCTKKEEFLLKIGEYLNTGDMKEITRKSYFDNRHCQTIFNLLYYIYSKTNKLASLKDIEFLINNLFQDEEQKKDILDVAHDIYQFDDEINWELVEEASIKFVREKLFAEAVINSQKDIEEKNYEAAIEKMTKATQVNFDSDYGVDLKNWENVKDTLKEVAQVENAASTGYDLLDSELVLNGGFRPKELEIICANSGVGKTLMMCNLAVNLVFSGKKVLYLSMETSAARLTARVIANILNLPTTNISYNMDDNPESLKKQYDDTIGNISGELRIKEFATNSMDSNQIEAFILDLKKNTGFSPDVVCVDYLSICKPNDHRISRENSYAYDKAIAEDLRALCHKLNCVMLTAAQLNRESLKDGATKTIISTENIANSLGIEFTADFILTLSQDKNCQSKRQLLAYVAKNRNNTKGQIMKLQITDTCRLEEIKENNNEKCS